MSKNILKANWKLLLTSLSLILCLILANPGAIHIISASTVTVTRTKTSTEWWTMTISQTLWRTSTYTSSVTSPITDTKTETVTINPTITETVEYRTTTTTYIPTTITMISTTATIKRDLGKFAEYRVRIYESLYKAWRDPIQVTLLKPIIDGLYADILKEAIVGFLPSTSAPLLKNPREIIESIDTLHQSYELIVAEPASEEQFKHEIELDYYRLGVVYLTAEGINIGQGFIQSDNIFWAMRGERYKERIYRVGAWKWWFYWEWGEHVQNILSGGKLLKDLVSSEKASIPTLQKILEFMNLAKSRASTDYYKTLIDYTATFIQAEITYLNSL